MKTLDDKIREQQLVHEEAGNTALIYIDWHLIHEVTTLRQAFESLEITGRQSRRRI